MNLARRLFIRLGLGGLVALAFGWAAARSPRTAWPGGAFIARDVDGALQELVGATLSDMIPSDRITLTIPEVAENGAIVPLTVETDLEGVESISLLAARNPRALTSSYVIPAGTLAYVSTRIKMQETAHVIVVVKAKGKLYSVSKCVKVAVGGCS